MLYDKKTIKRVLEEALYFVSNDCTIRELADIFGNSKTTVHYDLVMKLPKIDWNLYLRVRKLLDKHKEEAPFRASKAVHEKWQKIHAQSG